jgi:hypothetical protein
MFSFVLNHAAPEGAATQPTRRWPACNRHRHKDCDGGRYHTAARL